MSEARLRFTCQIAGPPELVFDLVADMPGYARWLPDSSAFRGTALDPSQGGTAVLRELDLTIDLRGPLKLLRPALLWGFRKENLRTLACLKKYVEGRERRA